MTATARTTASVLETVSSQDAMIYLMVMVAASDGDMKDAELSLIGDMVRHLPVFRGFDIEALPEVARSSTPHFADPDGLHHVLHLIRNSLPERLYETAYAIACDMAAADGGISPEEMRVLELLRHELSIDRLHAAAIERGARARYLVA